jgi:hypothetical protein
MAEKSGESDGSSQLTAAEGIPPLSAAAFSAGRIVARGHFLMVLSHPAVYLWRAE